jgi:hypothetical protein
MIKNSSDISFEKWKRDVSELFSISESKLISETEQILDDYSLYNEHISIIIYECKINLGLDFDTSSIIYNIILYLLKSTLYFDYSIFEDIKTKKSKKALIYGDLYLLQSGIEFSNLINHKNILNLLRDTLYSISISQNYESRLKSLNAPFLKKIIKLRYGSIFRLGVSISFSIKDASYKKRATNNYLNYDALYVTLENNKYLTSKIEPDVLLKYKEKVINYLEKTKKGSLFN